MEGYKRKKGEYDEVSSIPLSTTTLLAEGSWTYHDRHNSGAKHDHLSLKLLEARKKKKTDDDANEHYHHATNTVRPYQTERWQQRFHDLLEFRKIHKHCLVPHTYDENQALANWVKRQRYQYNQFAHGKRSSISSERIKLLDDVGFVWDSHEAAWQEKLKELINYKKINGHCDVPARSRDSPQLATWVKCQRRQYKLYTCGKVSNMTPERILALEKTGFKWRCRGASRDTTAWTSISPSDNSAECDIFMDALSDLDETGSSDDDELVNTGERVPELLEPLYDFLPDDTDYDLFLDGLRKLSKVRCPPISEF